MVESVIELPRHDYGIVWELIEEGDVHLRFERVREYQQGAAPVRVAKFERQRGAEWLAHEGFSSEASTERSAAAPLPPPPPPKRPRPSVGESTKL